MRSVTEYARKRVSEEQGPQNVSHKTIIVDYMRTLSRHVLSLKHRAESHPTAIGNGYHCIQQQTVLTACGPPPSYN